MRTVCSRPEDGFSCRQDVPPPPAPWKQWRARGQGAWPPGASLGGGARPACIGPNCKKKIRPRQISKVTSLQSAVADAGFTKRGGGRTPSPEGASRVLILGGGARRCKHWPRALETLGTPLPESPGNVSGYCYYELLLRLHCLSTDSPL